MTLTRKPPHINFHIGAPRLASTILKTVSKMADLGTENSFGILTADDYRQHLRSFVNGAFEDEGYFNAHESGDEAHWKKWSEFDVLAASQHAMMGHPKDAFQLDAILPAGEQRVARLVNFFSNCTLDLHLTIADQGVYLKALPSDYVEQFQSQEQACTVPSWAELVARILECSPDRRLYVWDFTEPELVALPFAVAMLNGCENLTQKMKAPITASLIACDNVDENSRQTELDSDFLDVFSEQYQYDLESIASMDNTVLIRSASVPRDLHLPTN